jgi:hypothetical protein
LKNIAKVISLDENIEEEAVIQINSVEFVTFIAYAPYIIEKNKQYSVEVSFFIDEILIQESKHETKKLIRNNDSFEYTVIGYLNKNGQLDVGFLIEDEIFDDYQYLYGKYINLKVDRINTEFIFESK